MKWIMVVVAGLCLGMTVPATAAEADKEGFVALFDGKTLDGWDGNPDFWSVADGAIRGQTTKEKKTRGNTFCIWKGGVVEDFELRLKFRIENGNSGVQYRSLGLGKWVVSGYQAEVCNKKGKVGFLYHEKGRGYLCNVGQKVEVTKDGKKNVVGKLGDPMELTKTYQEKGWNDYRIVARGNHIVQYLNGVQTIDLVDNQLDDGTGEGGPNRKAGRLKGILALQIHAGPPMTVEFKDIKLKVLKAD